MKCKYADYEIWILSYVLTWLFWLFLLLPLWVLCPKLWASFLLVIWLLAFETGIEELERLIHPEMTKFCWRDVKIQELIDLDLLPLVKVAIETMAFFYTQSTMWTLNTNYLSGVTPYSPHSVMLLGVGLCGQIIGVTITHYSYKGFVTSSPSCN